MTGRVRLGMLTPSSNTTLEPVTTAMLAGLPEATAHFGRFRVTEIALSERALGQFDEAPILAAAGLLADAKVHVIGWNGTSASWRGFHTDEALCRRITAAVGVPACTSVLALNEAFRAGGVRRFALVTPYTADVQEAIVRNYAAAGVEWVAERDFGITENYAFAEVTDATLAAAIREVAQARPQAIAILCTNLRGAPLVAALEAELGIPIYDSIATVVWQSLRLAGVDPSRVRGWGRLFEA